jgi:very-short-patch-repair endonuclease
VGETAAWVSFWPDIRVSRIACSLGHQRRPQAGYEFTRRRIPPELVVSRSGPSLYVASADRVGSLRDLGGEGIDQALRTRATTLALLHQAMELTAGRIGNQTRRELLLDSREAPWSKAERMFHRLLRNAGISGWRANRPLVLDDCTFYADIMFRKLKLMIEIDGRLYHTAAEAFESDRWRQNLLVLDGWCVLRFTWTH